MIARLSVFTLALLAIPSSVAEQRLLSPSDSIGAVIRSERANANARFSIQAEKSDGTEFAFDVVEASTPALTTGTILKQQQQVLISTYHKYRYCRDFLSGTGTGTSTWYQ